MTGPYRLTGFRGEGSGIVNADGERVLVIDTGVFLDIDVSTPEARAMVQAWRKNPRNAAIVEFWKYNRCDVALPTRTGRWEVKTPAEVWADCRRLVDEATTGQDPSNVDFFRSRPFPDLAALEAKPQARKVPPVIAHAPPARRGRWSRG